MPYTRSEFAALIRSKYPSYKTWDDEKLLGSVLAKHPEYQKQITDAPAQDFNAAHRRTYGLPGDRAILPETPIARARSFYEDLNQGAIGTGISGLTGLAEAIPQFGAAAFDAMADTATAGPLRRFVGGDAKPMPMPAQQAVTRAFDKGRDVVREAAGVTTPLTMADTTARFVGNAVDPLAPFMKIARNGVHMLDAEKIAAKAKFGFTPEELDALKAAGWENTPPEGIAAFVDKNVAPEAAGTKYARGGNTVDNDADLAKRLAVDENTGLPPVQEQPTVRPLKQVWEEYQQARKDTFDAHERIFGALDAQAKNAITPQEAKSPAFQTWAREQMRQAGEIWPLDNVIGEKKMNQLYADAHAEWKPLREREEALARELEVSSGERAPAATGANAAPVGPVAIPGTPDAQFIGPNQPAGPVRDVIGKPASAWRDLVEPMTVGLQKSGRIGQELAGRLSVAARDTAQNVGAALDDLEQMRKFSKAEKQLFVDIREGRVDRSALGPESQRVVDAEIRLGAVLDEVGDMSEVLGLKVREGVGKDARDVPFKKLPNYMPHRGPTPGATEVIDTGVKPPGAYWQAIRAKNPRPADAQRALGDPSLFVTKNNDGTWTIKKMGEPKPAGTTAPGQVNGMVGGGTVEGGLRHHRAAESQFVGDPVEEIARYLGKAYRQLAEAEQFGLTGSKGDFDEIARAWQSKGRETGEDGKYIMDSFTTSLGQKFDEGEWMAKATNRIRTWQSMTKLTTAALPNITQNANTIAIAGLKNVAKSALKSVATDRAGSRKLALRSGAIYEGVMYNFMSPETGKIGALQRGVMKLSMFPLTERWNRIIAANAAPFLAEDMLGAVAKGGKGAQRASAKLAEMGVSQESIAAGRLSEKETLDVAYYVSHETQFGNRPEDLPLTWEQRDTMKVVTQFKSFALKQTYFNAKLLREAVVEKNPAPLMKFLAASAAGGKLIAEFNALVSGYERENKAIPLELAEYILTAGTFGIWAMVADAMIGKDKSYAGKAIGVAELATGPSGGDTFRTLPAVVPALKGEGKEMNRALKRDIKPYRLGQRIYDSIDSGEVYPYER